MPHHPKPWFRRSRGIWVVQIAGKQHNLGPNREKAFEIYHGLMTRSKATPATNDSVVVIMDAFLEWTKNHRAPRTYDWYLERLQSFAKTIPNMTVDQLRPHHVQAWTDSHATWSDGMKRGAIIAVQRVFNWAVHLGHIDRNPVAHLEKPRAGKREIVITLPEYEKILALISDAEFRDLIVIAWETGARPQEIVKVESRHVDLENARWVFPQCEAKGKRRIRVVYLNETAMAITRKLLLKSPEGTLFRNTNGRAWNHFSVNNRFTRLKKKLGKKLCLYTFRHSFATRLLEAHVDALTVATLLGHADVSMLGRVYQHLSQNPKHLLEQLRKATA